MTARIRSGYSFRTAVGHLADVMACVKEIGLPAAPITDRNSTFAFNRWAKLAKENGLRPVFGVELAVTPQLGDKKPVLDWWTFIAKDSLRPLHDLVALATANPGKEPSLTYAQAFSAPGVFKITGERVQLHHLTPQEDLYVGLSPSLPKLTFKLARVAGYALASVCDNVYPTAADQEFYRVTLGWRAGTQTYPQHILSDQEWRSAVGWFADEETQNAALENRNKILEGSTAQLKKASLLIPEKPATLRAMCEAGARPKGIDLSNEAYAARLGRELSVIAEKAFEDYFYIIADLVGWAKARMLVGPGRGSSAGSLVCYLLGITDIDPLPHGLLFERFIDLTRTDLPDIDLDFPDDCRDQVFEYLESKYGRHRAARLGASGSFQAKSALNTVAHALKVPRWEIDDLVPKLPFRAAGDTSDDALAEFFDSQQGCAFETKYPNMALSAKLEGHPSNPTTHAAGALLTQNDILDTVAVDRRNNTAMCDLKDAEDLGLLKIDALGLKQLSIFQRTQDLIEGPMDQKTPAEANIIGSQQPVSFFEIKDPVHLYLGDCLDVMAKLPTASVDMIAADLPYGTTACSWDAVIPFEPLWREYRRIAKPNAAIVLTASQPFTTALIASNLAEFRYEWIWQKNYGSNFAVARRQPFKEHENICVFYRSQPTYNPIMEERSENGKKFVRNCSYENRKSDHSGMTNAIANRDPNLKLPGSVRKVNMQVGEHPTQKPVALFEYLIRTYTNPGGVVLDNTMGSGTTGVAAINCHRRFIGIEREPKYFEIASRRIADAQEKTNGQTK